MATYYIDTDNLSTATSIWTDSNLTVKAADGFYQKDGVYRQMSGGELLPSEICPACATPCGGAISASGNQGIYYLNIDLGSDTGAVLVNFDPYSFPDGILASFNSVSYNGLSSPNFGWLQGTTGLPTYIGSAPADCGTLANSPYTLDEFQYNGTTFAPLGTTTIVSVDAGQIQFTASGPGNSVIVIPKSVVSPSVLSLSFIGPCSGTVFDIDVSCPAVLPSFTSSTVNVDSTAACAATIDQTYYVAYVNGAAGVLGLYDLVFSDANGEFKLAAGFYKTTAAGTSEWIQVDNNGVIIAFGDCSVDQFTIYFDSSTAPNTYGWADSASACAGTGTPITTYITGSATDLFDAVVTQGKVLYTDAGRTIPLDGNNTWYKTVSAPASGESLLINSSGVTATWGGPC